MRKKLLFLLPLLLAACNFPYHSLPTLPPTLAVESSLTPSQTITTSVTPTLTSTASPTATETAVPTTPTATPTATTIIARPSVTYTLLFPLITLTDTLTPTRAYRVQPGTPVLTKNFAHPVEGCDWLSVAGQVFDSSGNEVFNVVVKVSGTLNGHPVDELGLTGVALDYGLGGYEVKLANQAVESSGTLTIQLLDLQAHPLTEAVPFNTSADCQKNVTLINFMP